jgi:hypothetical protein
MKFLYMTWRCFPPAFSDDDLDEAIVANRSNDWRLHTSSDHFQLRDIESEKNKFQGFVVFKVGKCASLGGGGGCGVGGCGMGVGGGEGLVDRRPL